MVPAGSRPRNLFSAMLQEKITVHAFSVVGFACVLLILSVTVYSVKRNDFRLNRFGPTTIPAIINDRSGETDFRNETKPSEKASERPPQVLDYAKRIEDQAKKTEKLRQQPEKAYERPPQVLDYANRTEDKANKTEKLKHPHRAKRTEKSRHPDKAEETEEWKQSDNISRFWKRFTPEPRVVRCVNISCMSKTPQQNLPLPVLNSTGSKCPTYFQWIYEDLAPWMQDGISLDLLEKARQIASFRVIIRDGRLFVEPYRSCYQTRSLFTIWGLLQLLDYYPGLVPDVDLMFDCDDRPVVHKKAPGIPPPVFRYCSTKDFWDIPFPDWSFWGWSEINIAPWDQEFSSILEGSKRTKWAERNPVAYWKGNPSVANIRRRLLKCNSSQYGAQIYKQDWIKEGKIGFTASKLADQCDYRYKLYVEGFGWSVSLKYILACNSPSLLVTPIYHDFFSRGLVPRDSYWPVRRKNMCESIKFAVGWGNKNLAKAETIGKAAQEFMATQVSMKLVYDYMLHLLTQYAKLLRFKPKEMETSREVCSAEILCSAQDVEKRFMQQSMVTRRASSAAAYCSLARERRTIDELWKVQRLRIRQIESWEDAAVRNAQ